MQIIRKKKKIIILVFTVITVLFISCNIVWIIYRYSFFQNFTNNNKEFSMEKGFDHTLYVLDIEKSANNNSINYKGIMNYSLTVKYPKYLQFDGAYIISQSLYMNEDGSGVTNDYLVRINIKPSLFKDFNFSYIITDYLDNEKIYAFETNSDFEVTYDRDGNSDIIIEKARKDIEESYNLAKEYFAIE